MICHSRKGSNLRRLSLSNADWGSKKDAIPGEGNGAMSERAATVASIEDSGRRHRFDRLEDTASDGVWVALGVRTTVFEVAFVTVVDEAVWNAH